MDKMNKRFLSLSGFQARFLFALLGVGLTVLLGCLGGGGGGGGAGSGGTSADNAQITQQLQMFMDSARRGDFRGMNQVFSRRLQTLTGSGETVKLFTLWDFGQDFLDPADDASFTFFFDTTQIEFSGSDLARVHAWTHFSDGSKFNLDFQFVKEDGIWMIDFLEVKAQEPGTTGAGGVESSVDLFPLAKGNKWRFVERIPGVTPANASQAAFKILRIDTEPEDRDSLKIFPVETVDNQGPIGFDLTQFGAVTDGMEFGRSASGKSLVDDGIFPAATGSSTVELFDILDSTHLNRIRFGNLLGIFVYGGDASFNGDQPWKMSGLVVKEGARTEQIISFPDRVGSRQATMKTVFLEKVRVNLPFKAIDALRLDISVRLEDTGEVVYTTWLFEPGLGPVAQIQYDETTRKPNRQAYLMEGLVSGVAFSSPGVPANFDALTVANLVPATPIVAGTPFTHTFSVTGGKPPYAWAVASAPAWLSINPGLGLIAAAPPQIGTFSFALLVKDSGSLSASYLLQWFARPASDTIPPHVISTAPGSGAAEVPLVTNVRADFSKPMATFSFDVRSFRLAAADGQMIPGTITAAGKSAFFQPLSPLSAATSYFVLIGTGVTDVVGNPLPNPFKSSFFTVGFDRPTLVSVFPPPGGTGVGNSRAVMAQFSRGMDLTSFASDTFQVTGSSSTLIPGVITTSADAATVYFAASPAFDPVSSYTVLIGTTVRDLGGHIFGETRIWSFTTDSSPTVTRMIPPPGSIGASPTAPIIVGFDRAMNVDTIVKETFVVSLAGVPVDGRFEFSTPASEVRFFPAAPLAGMSTYSATIASSVLDLSGSFLSGKTWTFGTGSLAPPWDVASRTPADQALNVVTVSSVTVTFTNPVDATSIPANFTVSSGAIPLAGTYVYASDSFRVSFVPTQPMNGATTYSAKVLAGVKNTLGQTLGHDVLWSFTTDTRPRILRSEPEINGAWSPTAGNYNKMTIIFDKAMNPSSINSANFSIVCETGGVNPVMDAGVPPTCSGSQATWTFQFDAFGSPGNPQTYKMTMGTLPTDLAGNPLDLSTLGDVNNLRFANTLSRTLGGSGNTTGVAVAIAPSNGDIVVVGNANTSVAGNTWQGANDIVVARFNPWGRRLWCVQLGSPSEDHAGSVAVDSAGNIYVTGKTTGDFARTNLGDSDVLVFKLNGSGNLLWKDQFGTSGADQGNGICVTPGDNNVFVVGQISGDFDGNTLSGASDGFMVRYLGGNGSRDQTEIIKANQVGPDSGIAVIADSTGLYRSGDVYGNTGEGNYNMVHMAGTPTSGSAWSKYRGYDTGVKGMALAGTDVWVIGHDGSAPFYANTPKAVGGNYVPTTLPITGGEGFSGNELCTGIAYDGSDFFLSGTQGGNTAFVTKYSTTPAQTFATLFGTAISGNSLGAGVAVDLTHDRVIVVGTTYATVPKCFDAFSGSSNLYLLAFSRATKNIRK
jgi:hypothetical protein